MAFRSVLLAGNQIGVPGRDDTGQPYRHSGAVLRTRLTFELSVACPDECDEHIWLV